MEASLDSDSVVSDRFVEGSVEIVLFSIILHPEKKIDKIQKFIIDGYIMACLPFIGAPV